MMKSRADQDSLLEQINTFEPVIMANDRHAFIRHSGDRGAAEFLKEACLQGCPPVVLDAETVQLVQVPELHAAVDHTCTATGAAVLFRSLIQPSTDQTFIQAKQDALREISANEKLRRSLQDCIHEYSQGENALYKFFNKGLFALFPYQDVGRAREAAGNLTKIARDLPAAESVFLQDLFSQLQAYRGSTIDQMMQGALCKTFAGLQSAREVNFFTPRLKFIPRRFTLWLLAGPLVALAPHIQDKVGFDQLLSPLVAHVGYAWTGIHLLYSLFFKPARDTFTFIEPLREKSIADASFNRTMDALGLIDELLSWDRFAKESVHATTLPQVVDEKYHAFDASRLKNPVLAKDNPEFVPNDVHLQGVRLTFISGPNSGGKTTLCKSITQNQLLAQAGAYIMAEKATVHIADRIRYQAPKFDGLQDAEGRFGTELARTRDIFFATTPRSLVILDELAEGTTYEERMEASFAILDDFYTIGNNTVLVTHNHALVDSFTDVGKGQSLMTEFEANEPTYRVVTGLSRVSHASRIAGKINFSGDDRLRYLKTKGYL